VDREIWRARVNNRAAVAVTVGVVATAIGAAVALAAHPRDAHWSDVSMTVGNHQHFVAALVVAGLGIVVIVAALLSWAVALDRDQHRQREGQHSDSEAAETG
jgi:lysylphosphatidylglycerol synthetase-like protein (DUF2156 family)